MVVRANRKFISMTYSQPREVVRCCCRSIVLCIVENDRSRLPSDREKFCSRSSFSHVGLGPFADRDRCPLFRRYWWQSGHAAEIAETTLLTRSSHGLLRSSPL